MIRNIKALGLALVAVFAMSAVVASGASAGTVEVEGGGETSISGAQEGTHVFSVEGNKVECTTANFEAVGKTNNGATSIVVHPVYTGCSAFGFLEATVTTTGCNYTVTSGAVEAGKAAGTIVLGCGGGTITIVASTCTATVAGQTINNGLVLENKAGPPQWVRLTATNSNVKTNKTKDGFLCPFNGTGEVTATYTGNTSTVGTPSGFNLK